jgi:cytochrome P450
MQYDTLATVREMYERHGPIFTARGLHRPIVTTLGAEAGHFVYVSGADNFSWRRGMYGEALSPLLGAGLITSDDEYHDRARRIQMPAFHARRMEAAVEVMASESARAVEALPTHGVIDVYELVRDLAMSIAMRALFGLDPHAGGKGHHAAAHFERALELMSSNPLSRIMRGPGSSWSRMHSSIRQLDALVHEEIRNRRSSARTGEDVLSMLLEARDEDGNGLTDAELRDQMLTLLFGGHDTSSSTTAFLLYELARHPQALRRVLEEQDRVLTGEPPTLAQLAGELPELDMALDETLRLYPPVWFSPRLSVRAFEFAGHRVPAGTHLTHFTWGTHRLAELFPDPDAFVPDRFAPDARTSIPKGAYTPFGGGQRICIGKRFGQLVVKAMATSLLQRHRIAPLPGYEVKVVIVPTLTPKGGLPLLLSPR